MSAKQTLISLARKMHLMRFINGIFNVKFKTINYISRLQGKSPLETIYNDSFFDNENQSEILKQTPIIVANFIKQYLNPDSVIDFGCGTGIYLKELQKKNIEVFGIDGSPSALRHFLLDPSLIMLADLTSNIDIDTRYDCAMCFEVAEHIPTKASETLVKNTTKASDVIIFSAAPKGQGGIGHINEQAPEFWHKIFIDQGYLLDQGLTDKCRQYFKENNVIFWLTSNIFVYRNNNFFSI